jgi:hypothetical protein
MYFVLDGNESSVDAKTVPMAELISAIYPRHFLASRTVVDTLCISGNILLVQASG